MESLKKLFILTLIFCTMVCSQEKKEEIKVVRLPVVAGSFYPGDPVALSTGINEVLKEANPEKVNGEIMGIVSPHAGYVYSAPVAAYAYKLLIGKKYDIVVVISPSHQEYFQGSSVYNGDAYETPLGRVPVNKEIAAKLTEKSNSIFLSDKGHRVNGGRMGEHSLEVQIPLLQTVLKDFTIVPIVMGDQKEEYCEELGKTLASVLKDKKALIVASSDLSHYHTYEEAKKIDAYSVKYFEEGDEKNILKCEACGAGPISAMLIATKNNGTNQFKILKYSTSGDIPGGDKGRVVGYMSGVSLKSEESSNKPSVGFDLTPEEKQELLALAKETIHKKIKGETITDYTPKHEILRKNCGAFVTIKKKGELRGCIGHIIAVEPLWKTVQLMAVAASTEDPRFNPVTKDELPQLDLEISVLSPIVKVKDLNEIEVGKDGLIITRGYYRGLLLPQVATEYNWDRTTFLEQTCRKAGLPLNAYKDPGTEIEKFTAIVFGE
jgi:MEMO1 family protein